LRTPNKEIVNWVRWYFSFFLSSASRCVQHAGFFGHNAFLDEAFPLEIGEVLLQHQVKDLFGFVFDDYAFGEKAVAHVGERRATLPCLRFRPFRLGSIQS
jgi:hypothetical protein